jgi:hypothetical protein
LWAGQTAPSRGSSSAIVITSAGTGKTRWSAVSTRRRSQGKDERAADDHSALDSVSKAQACE